MKNNFYVYAHVRNDTSDIFYIGKGKGQRAYDSLRRNDIWNKIVAKCGGFKVNLLHTNLTESEAFRLEHEYIVKLGRKKFNEGSLCNLTHGFDGLSGFMHSEETKRIMRLKAMGNKISKESAAKIGEANKRRIWSAESLKKGALNRTGELNPRAKIVLNIETGIYYETLTSAAYSKGMHIATLSDNLRGMNKENRTSLRYV